MKKIIISRITQVLMLVLLISTISFIMMQLLPGDPALKIAAGTYGPDGVTAEIAQSVRMELGLDKSMFQAYLDSLYQLFKFDLGYSLISGEKVIHEETFACGSCGAGVRWRCDCGRIRLAD